MDINGYPDLYRPIQGTYTGISHKIKKVNEMTSDHSILRLELKNYSISFDFLYLYTCQDLFKVTMNLNSIHADQCEFV